MTEIFYKTSDVARFCGCDPKSVHTWCESGVIEHWKTPGGHKRISKTALLNFLRKQGYPIPQELMP
jgi:DNA-binding transcriptional MerR regulator